MRGCGATSLGVYASTSRPRVRREQAPRHHGAGSSRATGKLASARPSARPRPSAGSPTSTVSPVCTKRAEDVIRSPGRLQDGLRDREPERFRGLRVDHQLELGRLLDGQVGGACRHAGRGNSHDISWFRDLHEWKMQHGVSAYNDDHALMKATLDEKLRRMHVIAEKLEAKVR